MRELDIEFIRPPFPSYQWKHINEWKHFNLILAKHWLNCHMITRMIRKNAYTLVLAYNVRHNWILCTQHSQILYLKEGTVNTWLPIQRIVLNWSIKCVHYFLLYSHTRNTHFAHFLVLLLHLCFVLCWILNATLRKVSPFDISSAKLVYLTQCWVRSVICFDCF